MAQSSSAGAWAADRAGWLYWVLGRQYGLQYGMAAAIQLLVDAVLSMPPGSSCSRLASFAPDDNRRAALPALLACLPASLPAGTLVLSAAMWCVWLLWRLLPPAAALRWLEVRPPPGGPSLWSGGGTSSSGGATGRRQRLRRADLLLVAGLSHERLAHLLLNLTFLALAGGAVERQLNASMAAAAASLPPTIPATAPAAAALAAIFLAACAASYGAAALLVPRAGWLRRRCPPLLGWKGADPGIYALLLLMLLAEARQQLAAAAVAAGASSAASASVAAALAAAALRVVPRPLLLRAAGLTARAAQLLSPGSWLLRRRGAAPSAVLLVAARVAAEQLLLAPGRWRSQDAWAALRGLPAASGRRQRRSFPAAVLVATLSLPLDLLRAAVALVAPGARDLAPRCLPSQRLAACAAAACIAACQALLLVASHATLGALDSSFLPSAAQLLLTALCLPLLAAAGALRWPLLSP